MWRIILWNGTRSEPDLNNQGRTRADSRKPIREGEEHKWISEWSFSVPRRPIQSVFCRKRKWSPSQEGPTSHKALENPSLLRTSEDISNTLKWNNVRRRADRFLQVPQALPDHERGRKAHLHQIWGRRKPESLFRYYFCNYAQVVKLLCNRCRAGAVKQTPMDDEQILRLCHNAQGKPNLHMHRDEQGFSKMRRRVHWRKVSKNSTKHAVWKLLEQKLSDDSSNSAPTSKHVCNGQEEIGERAIELHQEADRVLASPVH